MTNIIENFKYLIIIFLLGIFINPSNWIILILASTLMIWICSGVYLDYLIYKEYLVAEEHQYDSLNDYVIYYVKKGKAEGLFSKRETKLMNNFLKVLKKDGYDNFIKDIEKSSLSGDSISFYKKIADDYKNHKNSFYNP